MKFTQETWAKLFMLLIVGNMQCLLIILMLFTPCLQSEFDVYIAPCDYPDSAIIREHSTLAIGMCLSYTAIVILSTVWYKRS